MTPIAMAEPTKTAIRTLIIDLLEQESGEDHSALRSQVEVDLCDAAIDSVRMISIVLELERRLGISIADEELTPVRLRSLELFAEFLHSKVVE